MKTLPVARGSSGKTAVVLRVMFYWQHPLPYPGRGTPLGMLAPCAVTDTAQGYRTCFGSEQYPGFHFSFHSSAPPTNLVSGFGNCERIQTGE
ncbi:hypothetical protein BaRGS_00008167 [Batillaria attramentaria]|uniref:Uncharacterized protein n=1 Tax=Batillaria attramentaria TaxID=370345 RepID=A0ABD0LNG9_9CAEN